MFYHDLKIIFGNGGPLIWLFFFLMISNLLVIDIHLRLLVLFSVGSFLLLFPYKNWDKIAGGLFTFSLFYTLIAEMNDEVANITNMICYIFAPTSFYIFGKFIANRFGKSDCIFTFLLLSFFLFSITLYCQTISDISSNGFGNISRTIVDNGSIISATILGVVASLGLAGIIVVVRQREWNDYRWWLLALMMVSSLMTVLHLINRTGIVIAIITFVVILLINSKGSLKKIITPIVIIVIILYILIDQGIIGYAIFDAYTTRNEADLGGIQDAGDRSWRWLDALGRLFTHPFGWSNEQNLPYNYVHNGWLDIARIAGIIPFLCYTFTNFIVLGKFWKFVKDHLSNFFSLYLISLNIVFFLTIFMEPIIEANQTYFYLYAMLWGVEMGMLRGNTLDVKNNI